LLADRHRDEDIVREQRATDAALGKACPDLECGSSLDIDAERNAVAQASRDIGIDRTPQAFHTRGIQPPVVPLRHRLLLPC
jgi:hypothetical protein